MKRKRRNHLPGFKAKVALAAIKGDKTLVDLAEQFNVQNQIQTWKRQLETISRHPSFNHIGKLPITTNHSPYLLTPDLSQSPCHGSSSFLKPVQMWPNS